MKQSGLRIRGRDDNVPFETTAETEYLMYCLPFSSQILCNVELNASNSFTRSFLVSFLT